MSTVGTLFEALQNQGGIAPGLLRYISTTQIRFVPVGGGGKIKINGVWRAIPAAGINGGNVGYINGVAAQNLASATNYFVYLFWDGSALQVDYSTTGHATSSTAGNVGTEIKSGDDTRSLIGYVRTSADAPPAQFRQNSDTRYVRSWFNRALDQWQMGKQFGAQEITTSTVPSVTSAFSFGVLLWAGEPLSVHFIGCGYCDPGAMNYISPWYDSGSPGIDGGNTYVYQSNSNALGPISFSDFHSFPTDGNHTIYHAMWCAGGNTFYLGRSTGLYVCFGVGVGG